MQIADATVVGAVFYAEPFDPAVILGTALIFAGTWLSLSRERGGSSRR